MTRSISFTLFSLVLAAAGCAEKDAPANKTATAREVGANPGGGVAAEGKAGRARPRIAFPQGLSQRDDDADHDRPDRRDRRDDADLTPEQLAAREARRAERMQKMEERRQEMLETFDADGDGTLSDPERAAMHQSRVADMISRIDTDQDGKLSKTELEQRQGPGGRRGPDFATLDADGDGFVSLEEMAAARPPRGPGGPEGDRGFGRRGGRGGAPDGTATPPTTPAPTK